MNKHSVYNAVTIAFLKTQRGRVTRRHSSLINLYGNKRCINVLSSNLETSVIKITVWTGFKVEAQIIDFMSTCLTSILSLPVARPKISTCLVKALAFLLFVFFCLCLFGGGFTTSELQNWIFGDGCLFISVFCLF